MKIGKAIETLPNKIELEVKNISIESLNQCYKDDELLDFDEPYDPSNDFRRKVISKGYKITKLFKVYYSGWE